MAKSTRPQEKKGDKAALNVYPITHWSHSSLMAFLRNPLAWYKRYVEKIYDVPRGPAAVVGSAGHKALEHFYSGAPKEVAIKLGLEYLAAIPDADINLGVAKSLRAKRERRAKMREEYLRAIGFYLAKAPRHKVLGVELSGTAKVEGFALPLKAVSDLVVESRVDPGAVDVVDHKFVDTFSKDKGAKTLFVMQALFNYYVAQELTGKPVRRFLVYECKKSTNKDGSPQLRRYILDYGALGEEFELFKRLVNDASFEIARPRIWLPNPSDMFEGEHSFDLYRLGLVG